MKGGNITRLWIAALCVAAIALSGYFAWRYASTGGGEVRRSTFEQPSIGSSLALYLGGRPDFRICVDRVGSKKLSPTVQDEEAVRIALAQAFASLPSVPQEYQAPILTLGCPHPRYLSGKLVGYRERNSLQDQSQIVGVHSGPAAPSPYRVFVYFTDPVAYETAFGSNPYASTSEEYACQGMCWAITRAVYVPLDSAAALKDGLLVVLNLLNEQQVKDLLQRELYPARTPTALPPSR